jgi:hypothetical protein
MTGDEAESPLAVDARKAALEIIATLVNVKKIAADRLLRPAGVPDKLIKHFLKGRDATTGDALSKRQSGSSILQTLPRHWSFLLELDHRRGVAQSDLDIGILPDRRRGAIDALPNSMIDVGVIDLINGSDSLIGRPGVRFAPAGLRTVLDERQFGARMEPKGRAKARAVGAIRDAVTGATGGRRAAARRWRRRR